MLRVFIGFDPRQPLAYTVCRASVERHVKGRVIVEPLILAHLPITRRGLTEFTYSRYLVPWLCDYQGAALFLDADIIVRADVRELPALADPEAAVSVVQNARRFEWPSVMLFDAAQCGALTPEYVGSERTNPQGFEWAAKVGALPAEWNHLVGYDPPNPNAKLVHFTAGIPCWPETKASEHAGAWYEELRQALHTVSWEALMGASVHRPVVEAMKA